MPETRQEIIDRLRKSNTELAKRYGKVEAKKKKPKRPSFLQSLVDKATGEKKEAPCPGSKIRSEGKGQGLGIGQGKGPIGRQGGKTTRMEELIRANYAVDTGEELPKKKKKR